MKLSMKKNHLKKKYLKKFIFLVEKNQLINILNDILMIKVDFDSGIFHKKFFLNFQQYGTKNKVDFFLSIYEILKKYFFYFYKKGNKNCLVND